MRRPLGVTASGWFLIVSGLLPVLLLLLPSKPLTPQAAALAASVPSDSWFSDAVWWIDAVVTVAAGVLILRGARAGRVLFLAWGAASLALLAWNLAGPSGAAEVATLQATAFALALAFTHVAIYLVVGVLLLRQPAATWFALPRDSRSSPAWTLRGVLGTVLLSAAGFVLYIWLLMVLVLIGAVSEKGVTPPVVIMPVLGLILPAVLLAIGLAVAPGRHGVRRFAIVGLCAGLFTLFVALVLGTVACSPVAVALLPPGELPGWFGPRLLLASPLLLVLIVPCALLLRRPSATPVAIPG